MFTKNIKDTFTKNLLNAVSGVLGEAKKTKCDKGCKCESCEKVEESTEAYGKSIDAEKKKNISKNDTAKIGKLAGMLKREREGKEKRETNGVKCEEVEIDEASTAEKNKQYIEITHLLGHKRRVPVHPTNAYKALNRYRNDPSTKSARIVQGDVKEAIDPDLESELKATRVSAENKAKWHVTRNGKVLSTHTSKDAADVKAMKHPSNKVRMAEEIDEAFEQIDELSTKALEKYKNVAKADAIDANDVDDNPRWNKRLKGITRATKGIRRNFVKGVDEETDLDEAVEVSHTRYMRSHGKKASGGEGSWMFTHKEYGEPKGDDVFTAPRGKFSDAKKHAQKWAKEKGHHSVYVMESSDELTNEEQEFIEALNDANIEQIDEISDTTLKSYAKKALNQSQTLTGDQKVKRQVGARNAIDRIGNNTLAKEEAELTQEEIDRLDAIMDTLDEARGRPKKAAAKDFTVHPKTKEKLMHNNPEHMAKIEKLQKHGILVKPKTEANQHIINQLQRAKTSMRGGETVHFTHGESHHVSDTHASRILDKYAGLRPNEKEAFQKKVGHSHDNLKSEL